MERADFHVPGQRRSVEALSYIQRLPFHYFFGQQNLQKLQKLFPKTETNAQSRKSKFLRYIISKLQHVTD